PGELNVDQHGAAGMRIQGAKLGFLIGRAAEPGLLLLALRRQEFPCQNLALNKKIVVKYGGRSRQEKVLVMRLFVWPGRNPLNQEGVVRLDRRLNFFRTQFFPLVVSKLDRRSQV